MPTSHRLVQSFLFVSLIAVPFSPAIATECSNPYRIVMSKIPPGASSVDMGTFAVTGEVRDCNRYSGCGPWQSSADQKLVYDTVAIHWTYGQTRYGGPVAAALPSETKLIFAIGESGRPYIDLRYGNVTDSASQRTPSARAILSVNPSTEEFDIRRQGEFNADSFSVDMTARTPEERACHIEHEGGDYEFCINQLDYRSGSLSSDGVRIGHPTSVQLTDQSLEVHFQDRSAPDSVGTYREVRLILRAGF